MEFDSNLKSKSILSIITYFGIFYVLGTICMMIITYIVSKQTGYDYKTLVDALSNSTMDKRLDKLAAGINAYSNLLIYLLCGIALCVFLYKCLIADFKNYKENLGKNILYSLLLGALFCGVVNLISYLVGKVVPDSENQKTIEMVFSYKAYIPVMVFVVGILGPVIEELVFRKAIFTIFKGKNFLIPLIVSTIVFSLPHMLSTSNVKVWQWLIMFIPYLASGLMLGGIYKLGKENIYYSLIAHFINNIVAIILIFV
ncbi:MAG: lysostaphin resistance A-like protein [Anaeroplasmataceae bacterium]